MSARTKKTAPALRLVKSPRAGRPTPLQILAAFQRRGATWSPASSDLLLHADAIAPELLEADDNILMALPAMAAALGRQTHATAYAQHEATLAAADERAREAGLVLRECDAEAGFALGLAIGQMLGGGAR